MFPKMNQTTENDKNIDVLGIGNAIVDILVQTTDESLKELSLTKGSMCLIDEEQANNLYEIFGPGKQSSGGSAANTLSCIGQLGGKGGFIGRVKKDKLGQVFTKEIINSGAIFKTSPCKDGPSTARCLIFVTPDAQRTMCTYLGASTYLEPEDLDLSLVERSKILYLEGYLWDNPSAKSAFIKAAELSKNAGTKVALSLSDSFCVNRHRESFIKLIDQYVDILFANESEINSLYQTTNINSSLNNIKGKCDITAITCGDKGSIILTNEKQEEIKPYHFGKLIDTTGAGDCYAGGFLKGLTSNLSPYDSAHLGSKCAGYIVTQLGPRSDIPIIEKINYYG